MFIPGQYNESPIFLAFIDALRSEGDALSDEIASVIDLRWITTATGINLDVIGALVGVNRVVVDFIESIYFGFAPDPTAQTFTDLNDLTIGGRYRDALEDPVQTRKLSDSEFRILITAKILKNQTSITPDECLLITRQVMILMFGQIVGELIPLNITENTNASFTIHIQHPLSGDEQAYLQTLDIIPRPVGVLIGYDYTIDANILVDESGFILYTEEGEPLEIE